MKPASYRELLGKIKRRKAKIAVLGLGYVGLLLAVQFAKKGFSVLGVEIDQDRIRHLQKAESYITDVSHQDLKKLIKSKRFSFTFDFKQLRSIDVIIVCVPTPLRNKNHPNLSFVRAALDSILKNIKIPCLVSIESTIYAGATQEVILPLFKKKNLRHDNDFYLCYSPERIDPGNRTYAIDEITKVVGGLSNKARILGFNLYKGALKKVKVVSSPRVAEMAKLLENSFRLVNIGFIDEMAKMAEKMDINIWEVIEAAKTKSFGFMPFYPGPGVGGHCICKDPVYLYWKAKKSGFISQFIKLASQVTRQMPSYIVNRIAKALKDDNKSLAGSKILVCGVTYKRDIKDLRNAPPLDIINILKRRRVSVAYFDPLIPYLKIGSINLNCIKLRPATLKGFDCLVIATDHSRVDYTFLLRHAKLIFDTRNVYAKSKSRKVIRL